MSAIANITVFDGAGTPVSHTLTAISVTRSAGTVTALWRELLPSLPKEACISMTIEERTLQSGVTVTTRTTSIPVMESISGNNAAGYTAAPRVAYVDKIVTTQYASPRSTVASRRLARQLDLNVAGGISTSVTPVTTGPSPEAFDMQVLPT